MGNIPWQKIQALEKEISDLKSATKKTVQEKTRPNSIEGILKGVSFSESEIEEAKKAVLSFNSK